MILPIFYRCYIIIIFRYVHADQVRFKGVIEGHNKTNRPRTRLSAIWTSQVELVLQKAYETHLGGTGLEMRSLSCVYIKWFIWWCIQFSTKPIWIGADFSFSGLGTGGWAAAIAHVFLRTSPSNKIKCSIWGIGSLI